MAETGRYLDETPFSERNYYTVVVGTGGLTVYSECCGDTMDRACAARVYEALGRWLADAAPSHLEEGR